MSLVVAYRVSTHMITVPVHKISLQITLGGYRIVAHDGRVLGTGGDVAFAKELVKEHNDQVEKNRITGSSHL